MHASEARDLWHLIETVHAVTYFAPHCREANAEMGFRGFWMGYFGTRAAPMGAVGPGVVESTFGGFETEMVLKALPDAWGFVEPETAVEGRARAAAQAIREAMPDCDDHVSSLLGTLDRAVESADATGRPLFAANRDVMPFEDLVEDLWQMCTSLREHRGGGHVAVLTADGFSGCEAHVLAAAASGTDPAVLRDNRGWSEADWTEATTTLRVAGILEAADDALTERGRKLHEGIESRTDDLAAPPFAAIGESGRAHLRDGLIPLAASVVEAGWIPFPNPIGLPEVV
ncbi:MAG: hypothetical protein GY812_15765 [Actinomycetia bacterium]|nr:hypothetical protein [Actinomycetes bacterium]